MGLGIMVSRCSCDTQPIQVVEVAVLPPLRVPSPPSPVKQTTPVAPQQYQVLDVYEHAQHVLLLVQFTSATNFEGKKILLYEGNPKNVLAYGAEHGLDPHFCPDDHPSPIARFEPTALGWERAKAFMGSVLILECVRASS